MNITELREQKEKLQQDMISLITYFENNTGFIVAEIIYNPVPIITINKKIRIRISI